MDHMGVMAAGTSNSMEGMAATRTRGTSIINTTLPAKSLERLRSEVLLHVIHFILNPPNLQQFVTWASVRSEGYNYKPIIMFIKDVALTFLEVYVLSATLHPKMHL